VKQEALFWGEQRGISDNENIPFSRKMATLASDKELGDNTGAKYILCLLNKMTIMEMNSNIVWY